jgi:hypothetical protein
MNSGSACQLTLNVSPALEDAIVDWLLGQGLEQGFSTCHVDGHGSDHERLSIAEQVRGRQHRVEFRLVLEPESAQRMLAVLQTDFAGADVFYFLMPVLNSGHLSRVR